MNFPGNSQANDIVELGDAVIAVSENLSKRENNAVRMLREEVQARSNVLWPLSECWPETDKPMICLYRSSDIDRALNKYSVELNLADGFDKAEGYQIRIHRDGGRFLIFVIGYGERGILFGVGRLLRELRMGPGKIHLPKDFDETSAPVYSLRGHQLGYRPKTNSITAREIFRREPWVKEKLWGGEF